MQEVIQGLATATDMDLDDAEPASDKKKKKKKKKDVVAEATAEAAQEVTADQTAGEAAMEAEAAVAAAGKGFLPWKCMLEGLHFVHALASTFAVRLPPSLWQGQAVLA